MDKLQIEIGADIDSLEKGALQSTKLLSELEKTAKKSGEAIDDAFDNYSHVRLEDRAVKSEISQKKDEESTSIKRDSREDIAAQFRDNAAIYDRLSEAYLKAAESATSAAEQIRDAADAARQAGPEGIKLSFALERLAEAQDKQVKSNKAYAESLSKIAETRRADAEAALEGADMTETLAEAHEKANSDVAESVRNLDIEEAKTILTIDRATKGVEAYNASLTSIPKSVQEEIKAQQKANKEREKAAQLQAKNVEKAEKQKASQEAKRIAAENSEAAKREQLANELLGKSTREVTAELRRLNAERKTASKAGDFGRVSELNKQIAVYKQVIRQLKQARQLEKVATMQQIQAAGGLAGTIKKLSEQVANLSKSTKDGTLDISSLTNTVIQLSFAMKAGLGPISLIMLAIEAVNATWNAYAKHQKAAKKATEENAEAISKASEKAYQASIELRERLVADNKKLTEERLEESKHEKDLLLAEDARMFDEQLQQQRQHAALLEAEQKRQILDAGKKKANESVAVLQKIHAIEREETKREIQALEEERQRLKAEAELGYAKKVRKEQEAVFDGMSKGYAKLLTVDIDDKTKESATAALRTLDAAVKQREVANAQLKIIPTAIKKIEAGEDFAANILKPVRDIIGNERASDKKIKKLNEQRERIEKEINQSYENENEIQKELGEKYKDIIDVVSKLYGTENLTNAQKIKQYFQIVEQYKAQKKITETAEEELKNAELKLDIINKDIETNKQLAGLNLENLQKEKRIQQSKIKREEQEKKLLRDEKVTGSYSLQDLRTTRRILESDRQRLRNRLAMYRTQLTAAKANGEEKEALEALRDKIYSTKQSLEGLEQVYKNEVKNALKRLRGDKNFDFTPLIERNSKELERIEDKLRKGTDHLTKIYERRAKAYAKGDDYAVEKLDEEIAKTTKKLRKTARRGDAITAGDNEVSRVLRQIVADTKTVNKDYVRRIDKVNKATEQNAAAIKANTQATVSETQGKKSKSGQLADANKKLQQFTDETISSVKELTYAVKTLTSTLENALAQMAGMRGEINSLRERVNKIALRNA